MLKIKVIILYTPGRMDKKLLIKYLNNQCTETELGEVLSWLNEKEIRQEDRDLSFEIWNTWQEENNVVTNESFTTVFEKIEQRINNSKQPNRADKHSAVSLLSWLTKAAAILFIPVFTFLLYTVSERKSERETYARIANDSLEVIAPVGAMTVIQLSDGSEVQLNYGSKIKYPRFFSKDNREVALIGEAFFKVAHNPEIPFVVKVKNLRIKAVGTTFNVLAYKDAEVIETSLISGKVIVEKVKNDGEIGHIGTMKPGVHFSYNLHTGSISSKTENLEKYISWTQGKLIFKDTPILKVAERLSIMFNVDFEVKDDIKDYVYTVTFEGESLNQVLNLMTIATPISFKRVPRVMLPDSTFTREKIILEKRKK